MTFWASCGALLLLASLAGTGCVPTAQSQLDDEKEPHFIAGKNRVSTMDYQGAIECFEKALEVNPQSAQAHFELAWLFDQKEANPPDAIYHYEHYLQLRPRANNADVVTQRILACKQVLAQTVSLGPITEKVQREFEQLAEDNKRLIEENKRLQDELEKLRAAPGTAAPVPQGGRTAVATTSPRSSPVTVSNPSPPNRATPAASSSAHTHTVKAGETPLLIAREYGIKLDALMAANPRLDARRLRVGQALSIPGP